MASLYCSPDSHMLHQEHVRRIYEVPSLKDGSGKDIGRFHDTVKQHLRAPHPMSEDPTGSYITALLELKLDKETVFEWQKASQASKTTPHYMMIGLISLTSVHRPRRLSQANSGGFSHQESRHLGPPAVAFLANAHETALSNCSLCKTTNTPCMLVHDSSFSRFVHHSHKQCLPELSFQTRSLFQEL